MLIRLSTLFFSECFPFSQRYLLYLIPVVSFPSYFFFYHYACFLFNYFSSLSNTFSIIVQPIDNLHSSLKSLRSPKPDLTPSHPLFSAQYAYHLPCITLPLLKSTKKDFSALIQFNNLC